MIDIGIFQTEDGQEYDCRYNPETKVAQAIGPLPEGGQVGSRGAAFTVEAASEEEARQKLKAAIGPGRFV